MSPTSNPADDPATAVWRALGELFGPEAVTRKFGPQAPESWRAAIRSLRAHELERAMRRLLHGGKAYVPTLPEFIKLAKTIGGQDPADPVTSGPLAELPNPDNREWTAWALEGNRHLMGLVTRRFREFNTPDHDRMTRILVAAKNRWVELIEQADEGEREDGGKELWDNCMRVAWAEIERGRPVCAGRVAA